MLIEECDLFRGLSPEFMSEVGECLLEESYGAGALLYKQGDPANYLYILREGRIRVILSDHGQIVLVVSHPGDALGWSSLVEDAVHTTTAECLVFSRVNKIESRKLAEAFDRHPLSGLHFYRRLATIFRLQLLDTYRLIPPAHGEKRTAPGF
jgi:CRP/FNR family transcriptional regulator